MPLAPSPMESFSIGQSIGQANSPVTGIGIAIQNIVDDARKKGLLKAQSQFQTAGAENLAISKETRAEEARGLPQPTFTVGAGGNVTPIKIDGEDPTRGTEFIKEPATDSAGALLAAMFGDQEPTDGTGTVGDDKSRAEAFLKAQGAPVTPANIQAVIDKGLAK